MEYYTLKLGHHRKKLEIFLDQLPSLKLNYVVYIAFSDRDKQNRKLRPWLGTSIFSNSIALIFSSFLLLIGTLPFISGLIYTQNWPEIILNAVGLSFSIGVLGYLVRSIRHIRSAYKVAQQKG